MSISPRMISVNIVDDFWNTSTIIWGAVWAAIFHYVPSYLWKNRQMIVILGRSISEAIMILSWQQVIALQLGSSLMLHNVSGKQFTESELAEWKEIGILFRKTKYGYRWRNA